MATSKYPDDEVEKCTSEEQMFDLIDEKLPTNSNFAITGKRIREALKSLFKSVIPGSEKEYEYDFTVVTLEGDEDPYNPGNYILKVRNLDTNLKYFLYEKLKTYKYHKIFPQLSRNREADTYDKYPFFNDNLVIDFENIKFETYYETNIYFPVLSGINVKYNLFTLVISENEIPLNLKKCKNKYDESDNNDYYFISLNTKNDADIISLKVTNLSISDSFHSLILSYLYFENNNEIKNGKKIKLLIKGNVVVCDTFITDTYGPTGNYDNDTVFYSVKIFDNNDELIDSDPADLDLSNDYFVKDVDNNKYKILEVYPDYQDPDYQKCIRINNADDNALQILAYQKNTKYTKYHFLPDIFIMPPCVNDLVPGTTRQNLNYTQMKYNYNSSINKFMLTVYEYDTPIMEEDYSLNGVYSDSGLTYFNKSLYTGGIKDSYLEFTFWDKKWFFNGINR